jgi:hypothetical protein
VYCLVSPPNLTKTGSFRNKFRANTLNSQIFEYKNKIASLSTVISVLSQSVNSSYFLAAQSHNNTLRLYVKVQQDILNNESQKGWGWKWSRHNLRYPTLILCGVRKTTTDVSLAHFTEINKQKSLKYSSHVPCSPHHVQKT